METLRNDVLSGFDTERILNLPVAEKFRIVEYIKLLAQEASFAESFSIYRLEESPNFEKDRTYRLLAPLLIHDVSFEDMKMIILSYLEKFKQSDVYYAKFAVLGMGVLFIKRGLEGFGVFHTLLALLGVRFLTENLRLAGYRQAMETEIEIDSIIRYKEYQTIYRSTKYDLLAMGILYKEEGKEALDVFVKNHYPQERVALLYRIFSDLAPQLRYGTYTDLLREADDIDQMILAGLYAILNKKSLMISHYMMNSMIGKYSHFDQRPEKVEAEAREILASMKSQLGLE